MTEQRSRNAIYNILMSIVVQMAGIAIGLVIPRAFVLYLGSSINGLISLATQFSLYMGLIEGGVAAAAGAALYGPLHNKDTDRINEIMSAVRSFYWKTGLIFSIISLMFCLGYPIFIRNQIPFLQGVFILLCYLSIPVLGYLEFNKYNMMLVSNQQHYIMLLTSVICKLIIASIQLTLIYRHGSIYLIVLTVPVMYLLRLLFIKHLVKVRFPYLNYRNSKVDHHALDQKWNALLINISQMAKSLIPGLYLSLMFDLKIVSVYMIYALLFHVGNSILETSNNGLTSIMGSILIEGRDKTVKAYDFSETMVFMIVAFLSGCFLLLTRPFISIYIGNKADINYDIPVLLISFIINEAMLNLRFSPKIILKASGHLREFGICGIVEIVSVIVLTPFFCFFWGGQAVLFSNILSSAVITIYLVFLSYRKELHAFPFPFFKKFFINLIGGTVGIVLAKHFLSMQANSYFQWGLLAMETGIFLFVSIFVANCVCVENMRILFSFLWRRRRGRN